MAAKNIEMNRKNPDGTTTVYHPLTTVENVAGAAKDDDLIAHKEDYVRQAGYATTGGTSTAYTATLDPAPTSIVAGFGITMVPHVDCGASPTLNVNGKGATQLRNNDGEPFAAGDLKAGTPYNFRKVGSYFFASSGGGGVKINGVSEEIVTFGEPITKGDTVGIRYEGFESMEAMTSPDILPAGGGCTATGFSPDSAYLITGHWGSPYITIYKRNGDAFAKLSDPAILPPSTANGVAVSPDGIYLAVAHNSSPYVTIYKRNGDIFTKLSNPSMLPAGSGRGVAFSPNGAYLAVTHGGSPYVSVYKRDGDTFTKLSTPTALPISNSATGAAFSQDGVYLAISHWDSPYITIYKRNGDTFSKLSNPSILPTGTGYSVTFSPNGIYLAVGHGGNSSITIYKRNGDAFIKLDDPDVIGLYNGSGIAFSPDSAFLAMTYSTSPSLIVYKRTEDTFAKVGDPQSVLGGSGASVAFSPDGAYLAAGTSNVSPNLRIYRASARKIAFQTMDIDYFKGASIAGAGYAIEAGIAGEQKKVAIMFQ